MPPVITRQMEEILDGCYLHVPLHARDSPEEEEEASSSLRLMCLAEGLPLSSQDATALLHCCQGDMRQAIMSLQFWGDCFFRLQSPSSRWMLPTRQLLTAHHLGLAEAAWRHGALAGAEERSCDSSSLVGSLSCLLMLAQQSGLDLLHMNYISLLPADAPISMLLHRMSLLADAVSLSNLLEEPHAHNGVT